MSNKAPQSETHITVSTRRTIKEIATVSEVRAVLTEVRRRGRRIALVPTMGNLHRGHVVMMRQANETAQFTVATIFVNPLQFGAGEDYASYPRTLDEDREKLVDAGVDVLFVPTVATLYPDGLESSTRVEVPELSSILCGAYRPVHFPGVTTVVSILFNIVQPDVALFGEKDFQQLLVIKRMVNDLQMPIRIDAVATVREPDGLAVSSRNEYLSQDERARASALYRTLCDARNAIQAGETDYADVEQRSVKSLQAEGLQPEYFSVRRAEDLAVPDPHDGELVILTATWLGKARLIDNVRL